MNVGLKSRATTKNKTKQENTIKVKCITLKLKKKKLTQRKEEIKNAQK